MAIDLGRTKSASNGKYEAFIAAQLARAETRIRLLDLTASLLGFAALALACIVGLVFCDSQLQLSPHARQLALYAFLIGGGVYLFFAVIRPLRMRVNPYYAARQVEQLVPGAKNSIINWVDLHEQSLPPAIRGALGQRAAKELSHVDLENAISARRAAWMGGLAGLCAIAFVVAFFLLGPAPFYSLLRRAFNPFSQAGVSTRTQLTLIEPAGGDATITVGRGVRFIVDVSGKVPDVKAADAVKLHYRYQEGEPWLERPLQPEANREWTTTLSALEVQNGVWYKITGGDASTEEYRIRVRAAPAITDFLATVHYRPYVARGDKVQRERAIKELRGTEVLLRVRTNRELRDGRMEFEGKSGNQSVRGVLANDDPQTLLLRFVIEEDGKYRLYFTSTDKEGYSDSSAYSVTAIADEPPRVELTKPGKDIQLPANGILHLEGNASDDIGVKSLLLKMQIAGGPKLFGQPYRSEDKLRLADGGYPRQVEYQDFVELARVKNEDGRPFELRTGMELEYWLEAGDACDTPRPNVGQSKHYRVKIVDPEKNERKTQQDKKQSQQEKKQHEDKQDQKLQKESQDRRQERREQEARNREEQNRNKEEQKDKEKGGQADKEKGGQGGAGSDKEQPKNGEKPENPDGQKGDGQGGANNQPDKGDESTKEQRDIEQKINDALKRKEQSQKGQGESKPQKGDKGDGKETGKSKPESGNRSGEKSSSGNQSVSRDPKGSAPGDKQPNSSPSEKGGTKERNPMTHSGAGEKGSDKPGEKSDPQRQTASGGSDKNEAKKPSEKEKNSKTVGEKGGSAPKGADPSSKDGSKSPPNKSNKQNKSSTPDQRDAEADAQARKAAEKEIADLRKALQSDDPKRREEAKRKLEQMLRQSSDPKAREQVEKALERAKQPDSTEKQSTQPNGPDQEKKQEKGAGPKGGGTPKPKDGDKGRRDSDPKDADKENGQGGKNVEAPPKGGKANSPQNTEAGYKPGAGGNRRGNTPPRRDDSPSSPAKPSKPSEHRAAQLQLEDFLKKVDKNVLKDAGVSEEAWRKYVESRRKQLSPPDRPRPDKPTSPRQAKQLPSMGGKQIQPPSSTGNNDVGGPDRGQPPLRYRDPFREFNRKMSEKK